MIAAAAAIGETEAVLAIVVVVLGLNAWLASRSRRRYRRRPPR